MAAAALNVTFAWKMPRRLSRTIPRTVVNKMSIAVKVEAGVLEIQLSRIYPTGRNVEAVLARR